MFGRRLVVSAVGIALFAHVADAKPWSWKSTEKYLNHFTVASDGSSALATYDGVIARFSADGVLAYSKTWTSNPSIAFAPDGDLIAGGNTRANREDHAVVARYAPDGTLRWQVPLGPSDGTRVFGVAAAGERVIAVGLSSGQKVDSDRAVFSIFDAAGKPVKSESVAFGMQSSFWSVCGTKDGFVMAGGQTGDLQGELRGVTLDGTLRWSAPLPYEAREIECASDGSTYVGGALWHKDTNRWNLVIDHYDAKGTKLPTLTIDGDEHRAELVSISASTTDVVVASQHEQTEGDMDRHRAQITRFDSKGNITATERYGAPTYQLMLFARFRGSDILLAGEGMYSKGKEETVQIRGTKFAVPSIFVINAPPPKAKAKAKGPERQGPP